MNAEAIAAVLSVPTTGFVVEPRAGLDSTVEVRFFTAECEIDACGHVTIAVAAALVELGIWQWGGDVTVRARGGDFPLKLRDGCIEMTQSVWTATENLSRVRVRDLCAAIGALEESASVTTAAALALHLAANGQLTRNELVEQGIEMGRPSLIDVTVDAPDTATVRGGARKVLSGKLEPWSDGDDS